MEVLILKGMLVNHNLGKIENGCPKRETRRSE